MFYEKIADEWKDRLRTTQRYIM